MTNNLNRAYIKLGEAQMAVTTATDILKNHFTGFDRVVLERLVRTSSIFAISPATA